MTLRMRGVLSEKAISVVQELIEINIDSYNGFTQAAEQTKGTPAANLFTEMAKERRDQVVELQKLILQSDEEPKDEKSIAGGVHRSILDWRDAFCSGPVTVLKAAERGENYLKAKYEAALTQMAGSAASGVINRQYEAAQKAQARIQRLRNELTEA